MASTFGPIMPAPARDNFTFDFTAQIGASGAISAAAWICKMSDVSTVEDPTPDTRIVAPPTFSTTTTTALCGDMIDGAIYQFQAAATIDDGRVFVKFSELLCSSDPMNAPPMVDQTTGAVLFNYSNWASQYPEFNTLDPDVAQGFWNEACLLFRNDDTSPELDPQARSEILGLLTAHCAAIFAPPPLGRGGGGTTALAGVLTSKSVNGVSVGSSGLFPGVSGSAAWYLTTQYGAKAWKLMAAYRNFHYVPGPQRFPNQYWPYYPYSTSVWMYYPPTGNPPPPYPAALVLPDPPPRRLIRSR